LNISCGNPQEADALPFQDCLPLAVAGLLIRTVVDFSIDFERETVGGTIEVQYEAANGVLAAKFEASEPAVAQCLP